MTVQCKDEVEAILKTALRLQHLGLSFRMIDRNICAIMNGFVVVVRDRDHQVPWHSIVHPDTRVARINEAMGL